MKTLFCFLLLIMCSLSFNSFSQELTHSQKIIDVYGQEWYDRNQTSNPGALQIFDAYIESGFSVLEITDEKYNSFQVLESVPLRSKTEAFISVEEFLLDYNSNNFNPLEYKFFPGNSVQIFKLQGVNKIIRIQPQTDLINH